MATRADLSAPPTRLPMHLQPSRCLAVCLLLIVPAVCNAQRLDRSVDGVDVPIQMTIAQLGVDVDF